jgi:flagellar motility protein MotE (MotC chaperone)
MHPLRFSFRSAGVVAILLVLSAGASASDKVRVVGEGIITPPPAAAVAAAQAEPMPGDGTDANANLYCKNIANPAADARYSRQVEALTALEKRIDDRIAKLEAKRAEYEEWVKKREDFLAKADAAVVAIYSQMRPDAASQQIAVMDPVAAAAILSKLNPRIASAILNEMNAQTAAMLTNVMAGLPQAKEGSSG